MNLDLEIRKKELGNVGVRCVSQFMRERSGNLQLTEGMEIKTSCMREEKEIDSSYGIT